LIIDFSFESLAVHGEVSLMSKASRALQKIAMGIVFAEFILVYHLYPKLYKV